MRTASVLKLSETLKSKERLLRRQLNRGCLSGEIYVLVLSEAPDHLMDIYRGSVLKSRYYRGSDRLVIGFADSYPDSRILTEKIIAEAYRKTGRRDLRTVLLEMYSGEGL